MGEHLGDLLEAAVSQQGMANRQDQGMLNGQSPIALEAGLPQQIRTARHTAFHGVLHRHHRGIHPLLQQRHHHRTNRGLRAALSLWRTTQRG